MFDVDVLTVVEPGSRGAVRTDDRGALLADGSEATSDDGGGIMLIVGINLVAAGFGDVGGEGRSDSGGAEARDFVVGGISKGAALIGGVRLVAAGFEDVGGGGRSDSGGAEASVLVGGGTANGAANFFTGDAASSASGGAAPLSENLTGPLALEGLGTGALRVCCDHLVASASLSWVSSSPSSGCSSLSPVPSTAFPLPALVRMRLGILKSFFRNIQIWRQDGSFS